MTTATFVTTMGNFTVTLMPEHAPITVANFTSLAKGEKEWQDPRTGEKKTTPLYDGTIFHRIISDFMIQGGDPEGTGRGGPGYRFADECPDEGPSFTKKGILAMANSGPGTNGSQFFITVGPCTWLDGKHTIFGEVTEGYDVIEKIAATPTGAMDKPVGDVVIERIDIAEGAATSGSGGS